jgi:ketosteroid isomerase-like protein
MTASNLLTATQMIAIVEAYFDAVDRNDLDGLLVAMAPDCLMEYKTQGVQYIGRDTGIRTYFAERNAKVLQSWHGNMAHTVDVTAGRIATRFDLRRTDKGTPEQTGDNLNLFQFEGRRIKRISVWRGEANL